MSQSKPTAQGNFWLAAYGRFLFVLFVTYYGAIIFLFVRLLVHLPWLLQGAARANQLVITRMAFTASVVVAAAILVRLIIEVWNGVSGLVTTRFDDAPETELGVKCPVESAGRLHLLIADVGRAIDSELPDHVCISPLAECYVCEHREFHIRTHRELTLVLGMPHLAVLTHSELNVIIAHELAHYRGGDTRLGVFLHRFLEFLREPAENRRRIRFLDPAYWIRTVYFRAVLYISAPVWKYQELRADAASAKSYGGKLTARTLIREWLLGQQFDATVEEFSALRRNRRTPSLKQPNVFREFADRFHNFSPKAEEYVRRRLATEEKSSLLDSHPTMQARIETVLAYPDLGPADPRPARDLVPDFDGLERQLHAQLFPQASSLEGTGVDSIAAPESSD